jgi:hypothetical protein
MGRHRQRRQSFWERSVVGAVLVTVLGGAGWMFTHLVVPWLWPSDLHMEIMASQAPEIPLRHDPPRLGGDVVYCEALTANLLAVHNHRGDAQITVTEIAIEVQQVDEHRRLEGSCDVDVLKLHPRGKAAPVRGYTFKVGAGGRIDARYVISEVENAGGDRRPVGKGALADGVAVNPANILQRLGAPARGENVRVTSEDSDYQIAGHVEATGPGLYQVRFHATCVVPGRAPNERYTRWVYVEGPTR